MIGPTDCLERFVSRRSPLSKRSFGVQGKPHEARDGQVGRPGSGYGELVREV